MDIKKTREYKLESFKYKLFLLWIKIKNLILPPCKKGRHKKVLKFEYRLRTSGANRWGRKKGGSRRLDARYVLGSYWVCSRCGKKLSGFKRVKNHPHSTLKFYGKDYL